MRVKTFPAFLQDCDPNREEMEKKDEKERTTEKKCDLLSFFPTYSAPPTEMFLWISLHLSLGKVSFEDEKDLIC